MKTLALSACMVISIIFISCNSPNKQVSCAFTAGEAWHDPVSSMEFRWIPPGSFNMGSSDGDSDEQPVHMVTITRGFWIGTTVVTQKQYQTVMKINPSYYPQSGPNAPVEKVNWNDVQKFMNRLNAKVGSTIYRLPTEAEWEYACRAGSTGNRYGELDDIAWYRCGVDQGPTHAVGLKSPNAWGLYDMYGNVGQWCQDWYDKNYYVDSPSTDPNGANNAQYKVVRGLPFFYNVVLCRSASRNWFSPDLRLNYVGFRVVMIPQVQ